MNRSVAKANAVVDELMADEDKYQGGAGRSLKRLWVEFFHEYRYKIAVALVLSAVVACVPFLFRLLAVFLVDHVLMLEAGFPESQRPHQVRLAYIFISASFSIWVLQIVSDWVRSRLINTCVQKMVYNLRRKLHEKLQVLHLVFFESTKPGRIMSRILDDTRVIENWCKTNIINTATQMLSVICGCGVLFYLNWRLALLVIATLPFYVFAFVRIRPSIRRNNIALRRLRARLYGLVAERLAAVHVVKAFGREKAEERSVGRIICNMDRIAMRLVFKQQWLAFLVAAFSSVILGVVAYYAVKAVQFERMTMGEAVSFYLAIPFVITALTGLTGTLAVAEAFFVVLGRVFALLDEKQDVVPGPRSLEQGYGKIDFENITFTYPLQKGPALNMVNFSINPGERIAVMGPSGSGKTSLFHLLLRFYDPASGVVRVGGIDLVDADPKSIRRHVCLVQQEPMVFSGTIRDNIAYGCDSASPSDIMKAAKRVELHDFIMSLHMKYETQVGEQGVSLSGGQKQRLTLATALLTDPDVLLLDDTTSALDSRTEAKIRKTLNKVLEKRTSLTITHRIVTARDCDWIVVLEKGRVTQIGTHNDLKDVEGFYRCIWLQQGGEEQG